MDKITKTNFFKIILFCIVIGFYSCNQQSSNKTLKGVTTNTEQSEEDGFQRKLREEPKLFLKYWSGMTYSEYVDVSELLEKEGVLEREGYRFIYLTNNCRIPLETVRKDDLIIGIALTENIDCIYPLFQQKYNLPSLVSKNMIVSYLKGNNPKYNPVTSYYNGINTVYLPNCFIDKTSLSSSNFPQELDITSLPYKSIKKVLPKNRIVVENGSNMILLEQEIKTSDKFIYTYSLEESKEMQRYKRSEEGQKQLGIGATMTGGENALGNFIYTNSKTRTWVVRSYREMSITYMSKKDYNKNIQEQRNDFEEERNKKIQKEKDRKELEQRVYDDI